MAPSSQDADDQCGFSNATGDVGVNQPQLRMGFTRFDKLTQPCIAEDYDLRPYQPSDNQAWIDLLSLGNFGRWDHDKLNRMIAGEQAPMPLGGVYFALKDSQPVATACMFIYDIDGRECSQFGWLVVHPEHRGIGLGTDITRAVLRFIRQLGHNYVFLMTDDVRLSAIRIYLKLGFEPEFVHPSHEERWKAIRHRLAQ